MRIDPDSLRELEMVDESIADAVRTLYDDSSDSLYDKISRVTTTKMLQNNIFSENMRVDFKNGPDFPSPVFHNLIQKIPKIDKNNILDFHEWRKNYIQGIADAVEERPRLFNEYLKGMWRHRTSFMESDADIINYTFQSYVVRENLSELLYLLSRRLVGDNTYILNIDNEGNAHARGIDIGIEWFDIIPHMITYFMFPSEVIDGLVSHNEFWSDGLESKNYPGIPRADEIGSQMINSGLANKVYFSQKPHEIIIDYGDVSSITVMDYPRRGIFYKVKHANNKISLGVIAAYHPQQTFLSSDGMVIVTDPSKITKSRGTEKRIDMYALTGCIARDMFVCIDRTKHYQEGRRGGADRRRRDNRIIWLPRFRIHLEGYDGRDLDEKVWEVSPHDVTGHVRRCENPSPEQLGLANQYAVSVPPGYTFVRPYEREAHTAQRLYKSRSALRTLFGRDV